MPTAAKVDFTYRLKMTLRHSNPAIWRSVELSGDTKLSELHAIFQTAMGWEDSHLHKFRIGEVLYGVKSPGAPELLDEKRPSVSQLLPVKGQRFVYEYDFGDGWKHSIVLEKLLEPEKDVKYPICLAGARSCPPEDCGGPHGYMNFLEAISDSKHPEHESMVEWSGGDFNPEAFDVNIANYLLKYFVRKTEKSFDVE